MTLSKEQVALNLGRRLREIRLQKGLSMENVAAYSDMEYIQLSRIELGKINTSVYQVYKISITLSEPLHNIFKPIAEQKNGDQ
jgi:transcriptional regulator with XRE-family HTH domain